LREIPANTAEQKKKFEAWKAAIQRLAKSDNVYMKLSGMLSETGSSSWSVDQYVDRINPYFEVVLAAFSPKRIMWGSDFPLVNAGGGWGQWQKVADALMTKNKLSDEDKDRIWGGTAVDAYRLK
jgi:predicted TIM-barrel fold metal-dependent hydrolase